MLEECIKRYLSRLSRMKLLPEVEALDLGIYLQKENTFIISDLHLGYEKELHMRGILVPPFQFNEIKARLERIFQEYPTFKYIVINGDLKHEFGRISNQEWDEILELIDILSIHCEKIIVIKGNHDIILDRITNKRNVQFEKIGFSPSKNIFITHGHIIPKKDKRLSDAKTIIIGNEHPAVSLTDGIITEKYKCFLKGSWKRKNLIVQPSFCLVTEGTDILREEVISEFLEDLNLKNFEVFVVAAPDEIKYFGKIKNLEKPQK